MKKISKAVTAVVLTAALALAGLVAASADGYVLYAGYTFSLNNRLAVIHSYEGGSELYIPEYIWGYTVVAIEDSAFLGRDDFDSLVLHESKKLTTIGNNAFYGCTGFTRAELPPKTAFLGECAFQNCTGLKTADCSAALITAIERQTFYGCSSLENAVLPESLSSIGDWAFGNCNSLEYMEIPLGVVSIADTAFVGCENLTLGVWYDSNAYHYAKQNRIPYVLLNELSPGDANGDGEININDVTTIQKHVAKLITLKDRFLAAADANADNVVNIMDATHVQKVIAKLI